MKRFAFLAVILLLVFAVPVVFAQADSSLPGSEPPAPEDMTLENILTWILNGGCGVLAFFALERWPWFHRQKSEIKQYLASGLSGAAAVLAVVSLVGLGVKTDPGTTLAWTNTILIAFFVGAKFANFTHARFVLSGRGD